jgi:CMP-N,N'-diacetyllegionaminic acid synthase
MAQHQILAIIPARGGSKGVPGKNIRPLGGMPLIGWSIRVALAVAAIDRVVVSTDDPSIAEIARQLGAEVPFLRPAEYAQDETTDLPVYQHCLGWLAERQGYCPDQVVWLRPTAPLRSVNDVEEGLRLLADSSADWVRSLCAVEHHPYWMFRLKDAVLEPFVQGIDIANYLRRQLLPPAYRLNGAVDVCWRRTIMDKGLLYQGEVRGFVMPPERSVDIDTELDFLIAEHLIQQGESDASTR